MALELVTGYQGKDHVTAAQDSDLQRGIIGDSYRLGVGNQMEVEAVTSNELRILDGVCVLDGREFYIQYGNSETIDIESGASGLKRNDLICIQYDRDEDSGVESGSFVVIQGSSGTEATDPPYTDNDIRTGTFTSQKALARVRLDGINIEGIDMLIDVVPSLEELNTNLVKVAEFNYSGVEIGANTYTSITFDISDINASEIIGLVPYGRGGSPLICTISAGYPYSTKSISVSVYNPTSSTLTGRPIMLIVIYR